VFTGTARAQTWYGDQVSNTVAVTITVWVYPDIEVEPTSINVTLETGEETSRTLTIFNTGSADLVWNLDPTVVSWLNISPTSGTVVPDGSVELTLSFDASGLALGNYATNVVVTSNDPDEPRVEIPVNLLVAKKIYLPLVLRNY